MMNRRSSSSSSHPASFSKLPTTEQQAVVAEAAAERDIAVVAEYVTAVATTEQQPLVSLLLPTKATSIAQGLTWTDDFFEVAEHSNNSSDIVAVFDYDQEKLKKINDDSFFWIRCSVTVLFLGAFFVSLLVVESQLFIFLSVFLLIATCIWISHAKKTTIVVHSWMHTAVTRTGLRHVQTRPSPSPSHAHHPAFALDIPFEDIVSITRGQHIPGYVLLTLASTEDGVEYITSGDCYFQRCWGQPPRLLLALEYLKEPVIFIKLLKAMKEEKLAVATKSSRLGAELLCRVEKLLDGGGSHDHLLVSDPSVEQSMRELAVQMRELNNNINSSNIEQQQHDVATIV